MPDSHQVHVEEVSVLRVNLAEFDRKLVPWSLKSQLLHPLKMMV